MSNLDIDENNMEFLKESQNESQEEGAVNDDNYRL